MKASRLSPTAWLSLEEADDDPRRFWEYFIAALRTLQPDIGGMTLELLHASQPMPVESVLTPLINDLAGIEQDSLLILDDYHFIQSEPVHSGVTFFLEHLPPRMHLVIATRLDPPLPLAHFRGEGTMLEIMAPSSGAKNSDPGLGEADWQLSEYIMQMWTQFARTGNPSVPGLVEWPAYDAASDKYLALDVPLEVKTGFSLIAPEN